MAADSCCTDDALDMVSRTTKIFRKHVFYSTRRKYEVLIGVCGSLSPALVFVDWFPGVQKMMGAQPHNMPAAFASDPNAHDFEALIVEQGQMYLCDGYCRPVSVQGKFMAIGSGAKLAMAAMDLGAGAIKSVEIACKYDAHSRPPVIHETGR